MNTRLFTLLLIALLAFNSCTKKNNESLSNHNSIYESTKKVNDLSLKGYIEENVDLIISALADDAILLPPGQEKVIVGIDSINKFYKESIDAPGRCTEIKTNTIRFDVIDDNNATQVGDYIIKYDTNGDLTEIKGKMLIVWKKINGKWKIYLDMWH